MPMISLRRITPGVPRALNADAGLVVASWSTRARSESLKRPSGPRVSLQEGNKNDRVKNKVSNISRIKNALYAPSERPVVAFHGVGQVGRLSAGESVIEVAFRLGEMELRVSHLATKGFALGRIWKITLNSYGSGYRSGL